MVREKPSITTKNRTQCTCPAYGDTALADVLCSIEYEALFVVVLSSVHYFLQNNN
jgi:hypothetical protein